MGIVVDIIKHKIKTDQKLIRDYDTYEADYKLPKSLIEKSFHNNLFLGALLLEDELRNCTDIAKRKELKLDLIELNNNYAHIIGDAIGDIRRYYHTIAEEFAVENNGENLTDMVGEIEYAMQFEMMYRKYKDSDRFKYILTKMVADSHNANDFVAEYGIREYMISIQENIQQLQVAFPDFPMDYRDATIMYGRLNIYLQELLLISNTLGMIATHTEEDLPENAHRSLSINQKSFKQLLDKFDNTYDEVVDQLENNEQALTTKNAYSKFLSHVHQYKTRCDYTPPIGQATRFTMTTRELENVLIHLMQYCSYNMEHFVQFLLDNHIRLPLSEYKSCIIPAFLYEFDNSTIQKAFVVEGDSEMYDLDEMRKTTLSEDEYKEISKNLIHLEPCTIPVQ